MNRNTRGFTLPELLVATIVMGILGVALTGILVNDSRFVSKVDAMMNARQAARAAMNTMAVELQMVSNGGLTVATGKRVQARMPYAFGILCNRSGSLRYAVLIPTDSLMYATASPDGMAWRDASGGYTFMNISGVEDASLTSPCTSVGIQAPMGGRAIQITIIDDTLKVADVFYLHQTVDYRFSTSVEVPGRTALWRTQGTEPWEELLAPFDLSSAFRFWVAGSDTSLVIPPSDLSLITGLDLRLVGAAEVTPQGSSEPPSFEIRTRVNFLNRQ